MEKPGGNLTSAVVERMSPTDILVPVDEAERLNCLNQPKRAAAGGCDICSNPNHVKTLEFGDCYCLSCHLFAMKTLRNGKHYECNYQGDCPVQWMSNKCKSVCNACRWTKIMRNQKTNLELLLAQRFARQRSNSTSSIEGNQSKQTRSGDTMAVSRPSTKGIKCDICESSLRVNFNYFGPRSCQRCHHLLSESINKKVVHVCPKAAKCRVKWKQGGKICTACRLAKFIKHPQFERRKLARRSDRTRFTPECEICNNPKIVISKPYGLPCCNSCVRFIRNIIAGRRETALKCRRLTNDCEVKWVATDNRGLCSYCRWMKIRAHPKFTIERSAFPISEPQRSNKSDRQLVLRDDRARVADSNAPPRELRPMSRSGSNEPICSICDGSYEVSRSKYGPIYCKDCLDFIDKTFDQRNKLHCTHRDGSMDIGVHGKRRYILCKSCAWLKIKQDPKFNCAAQTNEITPRALIRRVGQDTTLREFRCEVRCNVCRNPNAVSFSKQFGLWLCVECYTLTRDSKRNSHYHECPTGGACDTQWSPSRVFCNSCRLKSILNHPKSIIKSML